MLDFGIFWEDYFLNLQLYFSVIRNIYPFFAKGNKINSDMSRSKPQDLPTAVVNSKTYRVYIYLTS